MNIIIYIVISLVFSAFFSGMEIAFISSNKLRHELEKKNKSFSSKILDIFYRNPNQFISTMLVGNNIALVVYGLQMAILLEPYIAHFINNEAVIVLIQSIISTILILFAGEFIPKTIFKLNPNFSLNIFAIPLGFFYILLYPISRFTSLLSYGILRMTGVKNIRPSERTLGKVDLDFFLQQSLEDGQDKSDMEMEVKMFQNAMDFSTIRLRDCIVPRTEIVACDTKASIEELKSKFIETGLSKIVVYNENIDNITGYIHSSELFKNPEDWTQYIQAVSIVPETMTANKLMKMLMQDKKSLAVVVDEFGGTAGIVTLEDLVEEIFGEIEDEHDTKSHVARKVADNEYLLSGRIEIDTLNEMFELDLPESDDYVTVAGFILHFHQKFPKVNETVSIHKYEFKIIKMTSTKIELVRMKVADK
ncbi:CBS domain containing-hemolysin-like protein [Parabacteroides sp. PF5-5]|uniref:hemolysin family protein n=1 Tax=unclassified Parabacteroides TaxID=2649774 RepID=UPI002475746B|nr:MULTISPECIES: hemolysin family protein [unclassified Parabacteroides]MDH6305624.1 CBS domain containing-hemolysin-like protein [Parabacteroides sp. PH5-39]MDH6316338.1 CBS domain containing-hemolysin-like protein [Parabacteroides sp. PF5-13]MDH6319821.1 CBS domain containing-hemolysin-like protein [Parabacteroides sp. PH5-13]MDH6323588.1 CBS domain containing-hemolysin-like protein [Parabacteroides sp. PH5-8]MDH6327525.1 CBS domain containing-hemolysin-like protein [Parabacteroides sp. PH5-